MQQYLELCKFILENGELRQDRTGTGTISYFGIQKRYDLKQGFPLLTTKKINFNTILHELIWFLKGDTNIKYLVDNNVSIWNEWPYDKYKKSKDYQQESLQEFVNKIKINSEFAQKWGYLGPVYGKQWRDFYGVDQIKEAIELLKKDKNSRRIIVSAWNPSQLKEMLLPPCHAFFQFYVNKNNELSCQLYQRSADIFLGVPFNIASYSILIHIIANICDLKVGEFVHTLGDAHIYLDHIDNIKIQLQRKPLKLPTLKILKKINSIDEIKFEDFCLEGYESAGFLKGKVSV